MKPGQRERRHRCEPIDVADGPPLALLDQYAISDLRMTCGLHEYSLKKESPARGAFGVWF